MLNIQDLRRRFEDINKPCSCPIWNHYGMYHDTLAKHLPEENIYSCSRAGGIFQISEELPELNPDDKAKISRWIYEKNFSNDTKPTM